MNVVIAALAPLALFVLVKPARSWKDDVTMRVYAPDHVVDGRTYSDEVVEAAAAYSLPLGWFRANDPTPEANARAMLARLNAAGPPPDLSLPTLEGYRRWVMTGANQ